MNLAAQRAAPTFEAARHDAGTAAQLQSSKLAAQPAAPNLAFPLCLPAARALSHGMRCCSPVELGLRPCAASLAAQPAAKLPAKLPCRAAFRLEAPLPPQPPALGAVELAVQPAVRAAFRLTI